MCAAEAERLISTSSNAWTGCRLIVVALPVGLALLVAEMLLIAIAARDGAAGDGGAAEGGARLRREAWHAFFSPSKRPIATLELDGEQACRWRMAVVRSASLVVPRRRMGKTATFISRAHATRARKFHLKVMGVWALCACVFDTRSTTTTTTPADERVEA